MIRINHNPPTDEARTMSILPFRRETPAAEALAALADTPTFKAALAERSASLVLTRKGYVAELRKLQRDAEETFPKLAAAVDVELAKLRKAEEALLSARQRLGAAVNAKSGASHQIDQEQQRLEQLLRENADPAIDDFRNEMLDDLDKTRKGIVTWSRSETNQRTGETRQIAENNVAAIAARVAAVNAALMAAEDLRLEPDQGIVPARLAAMRDALPSINEVAK